MTRPIGTFPISSNFEVKIKWTFDARQLVQSYNDLLTFTEDNYLPNGFTVSVFDSDEELRGIYQLINEDDLPNPESWVKIGGSNSNTENIIVIEVDTDGNFELPPKSILHMILIIPENPVTLDIGTTASSSDIYEQLEVNSSEVLALHKYFATATNIYFTGITSTTKILGFYEPLGTLI